MQHGSTSNTSSRDSFMLYTRLLSVVGRFSLSSFNYSMPCGGQTQVSATEALTQNLHSHTTRYHFCVILSPATCHDHPKALAWHLQRGAVLGSIPAATPENQSRTAAAHKVQLAAHGGQHGGDLPQRQSRQRCDCRSVREQHCMGCSCERGAC